MTDERGLVVVTGGGRGIGRGIVERLLADGYTVASLARTAPAVTDGAEHAFAVDVADERGVAGAFDAIDALGVPIVGAVTAAGINHRGDAFDFPVEEFRRMLDVNVLGTFLVAREAARRMTGGGSVVLISSTMAFVGSQRRQSPYNATKGAVSALATALAIEWADRGIRVNAIAPTFTETEMNAPVLADPVASQRVLESIPLGRFGTVRDIASATSWLLSDESGFVTGCTLPVDGGYLAQ